MLKKSKTSDINPAHRWDGKSKEQRLLAGKKAADTKRRMKLDAEKEEGLVKKKRILLVVEENLLLEFDQCRKMAHDLTLTAGIRSAMQRYIEHQKMVNR